MIKRIKYFFNWLLLLGCTLIVCVILGVILWDIFSKGMSSVSWNFISHFPTSGMTKGGILPAIVGTVLLTFITTIFAVPFGVACAIYLNEYARPSMLTNIIRASIRNLAGMPCIICAGASSWHVRIVCRLNAGFALSSIHYYNYRRGTQAHSQ